jgi:hypothetical protein
MLKQPRGKRHETVPSTVVIMELVGRESGDVKKIKERHVGVGRGLKRRG